ncbi:Cytochrome c oxidase subunit 6B-like protein new16 [Erysiphe necator]|uniref:Putative cytochrome c oxidase subunit vib protein n=1 Tax=Uncinula necator TaxID=52586 RepID=A0A0B1P2Q4_UNCNE|nr:Cytochrome c oxidase subunit 6B-like protein new16 [Erysiphe necator]KHJ32568.1 putative cytochrome c oxidase subunit vib protein [Erysiphe necator]
MRFSEIFGSSVSSPKISSDGAPIAPDRTQRQKCWEARDAFFKCLDQHEIIDSIREKEKADKFCNLEEKPFRTECASSWVTYFKQRRVAEWKKAQTLERLKAEGAVRIEGELPPLPVKR